jgi:hypothetical protein
MRLEKRLSKATKYITKYRYKQICTAFGYEDEACVRTVEKTKVIFPAFLALHALQVLPKHLINKSTNAWIRTISQELYDEGKDNFSFNYSPRNYKRDNKLELPDDLYNTACSLAALYRCRKEISEKYFLKIMNLEINPGGPYRTWFPGSKNFSKRPNDVDPIANAAFLYFAALYGIKLKNTRRYIMKCLKSYSVDSSYYPYSLMFYFNLAKYVNSSNDNFIKKLLARKLRNYQDKNLKPQEILLYNLARGWLGLKVNKRHLEYIVSIQKSDGSLNPLPIRYNYTHKKNRTYVSNKISTTSLFIELLALISEKETKKQLLKINPTKKIILSIKKDINKELFAHKIKTKTSRIFPIEKDYKPIFVPVYLAYSLKKKLSKKDKTILNHFCLAAFFTWTSYTIMDKVLDDQLSKDSLPIANTLMRIGLRYSYKVIDKCNQYEQSILKAFNICDRYYEWEMKKARFRTTEDISKIIKKRRSTSYIQKRMEPFLVSLKYLPLILGIKKKNLCNNLYQFFSSQILIDQFNDDLHDWNKDKRNGIMTYVIYLIYKESLDTKKHDRIFNKKVILKVIDECKKEHKKADTVLSEMELQNDAYLKSILNKSIEPIRKIEKEYNKVGKIIKAFR